MEGRSVAHQPYLFLPRTRVRLGWTAISTLWGSAYPSCSRTPLSHIQTSCSCPPLEDTALNPSYICQTWPSGAARLLCIRHPCQRNSWPIHKSWAERFPCCGQCSPGMLGPYLSPKCLDSTLPEASVLNVQLCRQAPSFPSAD